MRRSSTPYPKPQPKPKPKPEPEPLPNPYQVDAAQLRAALRSSGAITRMYSQSLRTLTLTLTLALALALYPLPGTARACAP